MNDKNVYLHYTQAELDRNFDQRGWVSNALEVIARYPVSAAATRKRLVHEANVPYGPTPHEVLDIFPAAGKHAPVVVFVHGGAWRNFTKDDYSFVADGFVPHGYTTVMVNFAKILEVPLPVMVEQVRRAFSWVHANIARFGGDPRRLFVSGHSSGAHQAATALCQPGVDLPHGAIRAAALVSGPYDMQPVLLSARSSYVKLSPAEADAMSPLRHVDRMPCPVYVGYCEHDTDVFQDLSREFAAALDRVGLLLAVDRFPGFNHFEHMEEFGRPDSALIRAIVKHFSRLG